MSKLRNQIESAKQEYEQLRYSGDLASEILSRSQPRRHVARWIWNIGVVAAAAMILIFVRLRTSEVTVPTPNNNGEQIAEVSPTEEPLTQVAWSDLPSLSMPTAPALDTRGSDEMNMAPSAPTFDFSTPSFSLVEESEPLQSMNTSNAEETVL